MTLGSLHIPGLFIGDFETAQDAENFPDVTSVLCAARGCQDERRIGRNNYMYVDLLDDGEDALLPHIDACITFIATQLSKKHAGCLVHCMHGVSRSVAICTGYIMRLEKISFAEAYEKVRASYPRANISDSFKAELEQFGCEFKWNMKLDTQPHRLYWQSRNSKVDSKGDAIASVKYDCRMCRHTLFHDIHVMKDVCHNSCSIYPVERMAWMIEGTEESTGKVICYNCKTKIGHYSWPGLKCPCGRWHSPAFFIQKVRVDNRSLP